MGVSGEANVNIGSLQLNKNKIRSGESLLFSFEIISNSKKSQKLVIDYLIHFKKANGSLKSKVYKLKTIELKPNETLFIQKSHSLRPITTMVYYSGDHEVSIQVNGKVVSNKPWNLEI